MDWNWEEFTDGPASGSADRMHITVNRRGCFHLSRRAIERLGEPDSVVLMFDRRRGVIGMVQAPFNKPNAFRLKRKQGKAAASRVVYAANFCRRYAICPDDTIAFNDAKVDKDGVPILDLNEVRSVKKK
jgi:hypothetical protein